MFSCRGRLDWRFGTGPVSYCGFDIPFLDEQLEGKCEPTLEDAYLEVFET